MADRFRSLLPARWIRDLRGRPTSVVVFSATLLVAVFLAAIGAGYTATRPVNDTGGAVLAKGNTVAYVNGESGRVEAEARALATGASTLETVTLSDGRVAVVDNSTGRVWVVDTARMTPQGGPIDRGAGRAGTPAPLTVVAGPAHSYLVDAAAGTVEEIGPQGAPTAPVSVPGGTTGVAVPDGSDGVWVLTTQRTVAYVRSGKVVRQVDSGGRIEHLTVADGHPIAITDSGELLEIATDPVRRIAGDRVAHGPNVVVGSPEGAGRWILIVDRRAGELLAIDPRTGSRRVFSDLPDGSQHNVGAPVVVGDVVYLPDYATHTVYVRNIATGQALKDIPVPGESKTISLAVHGEKLWVNDPNDRRAVVVDSDGIPLVVDKGTGEGLTDTTVSGGASKASGPAPGPAPAVAGSASGRPAHEPPVARPPADAAEPESAQQPEATARRLVTVPDIRPGTSKDEACQRIEQTELLCGPVAAGGGGRTGEVIGTDPPGGASVPAGYRVTVHHYGPTAVPEVVGRFTADACREVETSGLRCASEPDPQPVASPDRLDVVVSQDPAPGAAVATGSIVTVRYGNQAILGDYRNRPGAEACADIEAAYRRVPCRVVEGQSTAQTGSAASAGTGYDQSPAPGSAITMGQTVTITVAKGSPQVPDVRGMGRDQACQTLAAHYTCDARPDAIARHAVVTAQDTAPGTPMDSGTVVIHYAPYEPVALRLYQSNTGEPVFLVRTDGDPHERYSQQYGGILGYGYASSWEQPGTVMIWDHYCTSNPNTCLGYSTNHYQSRDSKPFHDNWGGPQEAARFIAELGPDSCAAGQVPMYRFAKFSGRDRDYIVGVGPSAPPGYPSYKEFLGCLWSP